jgi:hypothetical protein
MKKKIWSKAEVDGLNQHQYTSMVHPYTCDRSHTECEVKQEPRDYSKDGVLEATEYGWVCPCGKYTQDWYHR